MLKLSKITLPRTSIRLNLMVVCEIVLLLFLSLTVMLYFSRQGFLDSYSTSNHDRVRAPSSSGDTSDGDAEEIEGIANEYIRRQ